VLKSRDSIYSTYSHTYTRARVHPPLLFVLAASTDRSLGIVTNHVQATRYSSLYSTLSSVNQRRRVSHIKTPSQLLPHDTSPPTRTLRTHVWCLPGTPANIHLSI